MKKIKIYTLGFIGYLFYKIVWVEDKSGHGDEYGNGIYTSRGFVMQKRLGSMLLVTPIMLVVYFFLYGISCFDKWFKYIFSYRCRYIVSSDRNLTFKRKLSYIHHFLFN